MTFDTTGLMRKKQDGETEKVAAAAENCLSAGSGLLREWYFWKYFNVFLRLKFPRTVIPGPEFQFSEMPLNLKWQRRL
jgi:hypothetical protein